jgi:hypothetical protein
MVPFSHFIWDESFSGLSNKSYDIYENAVAPGYFAAMRIPLFEGRDLAWKDTTANGLKVILNQAAAKVLCPDRDPIGQFITKQDGDMAKQYQVIGVVGDAKYQDLRTDAPPTAYMAMTQDAEEHSRSYVAVVRIEGPAGPLADAARALVRRMNPEVPSPVITSMMSVVDDSLSAERTMALLAVFFAVCALVVTAVGLYGTLAYATARRTSEIGIRMALGARRVQVIFLVLRQNAAVAMSGTIAGLLGALLATRALASFLYGITVRDPWVFAGSIVALALIASAASLLPALRAAQVEPMAAIRCE